MADDRSDNEQDVYFQTARITFLHPETGDKITRNFVGQAFFTPEEIEKFGDVKVENIFYDFALDVPYNPFEDAENAEAHIALTNRVRDAMGKDSG